MPGLLSRIMEFDTGVLGRFDLAALCAAAPPFLFVCLLEKCLMFHD